MLKRYSHGVCKIIQCVHQVYTDKNVLQVDHVVSAVSSKGVYIRVVV